jgi:tetratricopeptide (TPR) repeat protein
MKDTNNEKVAAIKWFNKGKCFTSSQNYHDAIEAYDKAIEEDITFAEAYFERGLCYNKIGEYNKEINDITIAAKYGLVSAQIYQNQHIKCPKCGYIKEKNIHKCQICGFVFFKKDKSFYNNKKNILLSFLVIIILLIGGCFLFDYYYKQKYNEVYSSLKQVEIFLKLLPYLKKNTNDYVKYSGILNFAIKQTNSIKDNSKRSEQLRKICYYYMNAKKIWAIEKRQDKKILNKKYNYTKEFYWKKASELLSEYEKINNIIFSFILGFR